MHDCALTPAVPLQNTHTQRARRKRALNRLSDIDSLMPCHLTVFRFSSQSNTSRTHAAIWLPDSRFYRSILQKQGDRNPISMKHCDFTAPHNIIMPQAQLQSSYQSSYSFIYILNSMICFIYFPLLSFCFYVHLMDRNSSDGALLLSGNNWSVSRLLPPLNCYSWLTCLTFSKSIVSIYNKLKKRMEASKC